MNNQIFDAIYANLQTHYSNLGQAYFGKSMNRYLPNYLFDTPINRLNTPLPDNHSKVMLDQVVTMIASAAHFVDITNLGFPAGAFLDAIVEGLNRNPNKITMRILCGRGEESDLNTNWYVKDIQKRINNKPMVLHVGVQQVNKGRMPLGWNHSKYIAVDGRSILFGGHNFISEPYFGHNPIFDLSVKLDGPLATGAHLFSNALWTYVNEFVLDRRPQLTTFADSLENNIVTKRLAPMWRQTTTETGPEYNVPTIHVTQPGLGILNDPAGKFPNPSLTALYTAIAHAQNEICISQQDIGGEGGARVMEEGMRPETVGKVPLIAIKDPTHGIHKAVNYYDVNLFNNLYTALMNKPSLQIKIVLTNVGAYNENGRVRYYYGASFGSVYRAFGWFLMKEGKCSVDKTLHILRNQVHIRTIAVHGSDKWRARPGRTVGNHAKFWSVDNAVCYVGSHNMYPSTKHIILESRLGTGHLQEWGAIMGNNEQNVVGQIQERYFNDLFERYSFAKQVEPDFLKGI